MDVANPHFVDKVTVMTDSELDTAAKVTAALGGAAALARLTEVSTKAVSNWVSTRNFPPRTYAVMTAALASKGLRAPPRLWKMSEAAEA